MTLLKISHWFVVAGCFTLALCQLPAGFPGGIMRVERNWYALPTDRAGTVVTRVHRDSAGAGAGGSVLYQLDTHGPPAPFAIDPHSGVVTVNDTLQDKENRSYSLWVIASEDGSITQKIEVLATITDITGQRPKVPQPPPFSLPKFPPGLLPQPTFTRPTHRTTAATEQYEEEENTISEHVTTTTRSPPRRPDDLPLSLDGGSGRNLTSVSPPPALPHPSTPPDSSELPLTVIPLIAIGALVLIVAGVILFVWKKNSGSKANSKKEDMSKEASAITSTPDAALNMWERPRAYSNRYEAWDNNHLQISEETTISEEKQEHDEWEFPRHRLRIFNIVGEGAFGQVWRAHAIDIDGKKGELTVAVKTLKENASEKEKSDLLQELAVMKGLGTHPNVVRLLACCTSKEPTLVIMEFVSLGKLQQFLRDSRAERHYRNTHAGSQFLTSRDLTHQAFQVARGMEFLASKGIIHRDLAARNVLITEERTCKVADFGFARDVAGTHVYERKSDGRLPIRWMAPESLYDDIFSVKSDIWSFGVLLWEIVTLGSTPYPGLSAGDVMRKVRAGHRLEKPEHCRRELYNIMYYCWESDSTARPDFTEVVTMLERLLCTETDYIELERFPDHSYYNLQHLDGEKL